MLALHNTQFEAVSATRNSQALTHTSPISTVTLILIPTLTVKVLRSLCVAGTLEISSKTIRTAGGRSWGIGDGDGCTAGAFKNESETLTVSVTTGTCRLHFLVWLQAHHHLNFQRGRPSLVWRIKRAKIKEEAVGR